MTASHQEVPEQQVARPSGLALLNVVFLGLAAVAGIAAIVIFLQGAHHGPTFKRVDLQIGDLEKAVQANPQDPDARIAVANAYSTRGLWGNAEKQFQQALTLRPNDQGSLIGLAKAQTQLKDLDGALQSYLRVVDLNKDVPMANTSQEMEAVFYSVGSTYFQKGDPASATTYLQKALTIEPTDSDAWYLVGQISEKAGQYDQAVAAYGSAVTFTPDFIDGYRALERCYQRLGKAGETAYAKGMIRLAQQDNSGAIGDLRQAVKLSPQFAVAYEGLGLAYEADGQKGQALDNFKKATALDPQLMLASMGLQRLQPNNQ